MVGLHFECCLAALEFDESPPLSHLLLTVNMTT